MSRFGSLPRLRSVRVLIAIWWRRSAGQHAIERPTPGRSGANTKLLLIAASIIAFVVNAATALWWQWPQKASPTAAVQTPATTQPKSSAATAIASNIRTAVSRALT